MACHQFVAEISQRNLLTREFNKCTLRKRAQKIATKVILLVTQHNKIPISNIVFQFSFLVQVFMKIDLISFQMTRKIFQGDLYTWYLHNKKTILFLPIDLLQSILSKSCNATMEN